MTPHIKWRDPIMKTGNVGHNHVNNFTPPSATSKQAQATSNAWQMPQDTFTRSLNIAANPTQVNQLWRDSNHVTDSIRTLISSALGRSNATGQGFWAQRADNVALSQADRLQAQQLISDDGFFGVTQTTGRIMNFAMAMVGENASESQIETMRAAVQRGFDDVARMFGGFDKLPQVTQDTHTAIIQRFDEWLGR